MWSDDVISWARCGKYATRVFTLFDFRRDKKEKDQPFILSVIIVVSCGDLKCEKTAADLYEAKLKTVADRIATGGSKAWRNWRYATAT